MSCARRWTGLLLALLLAAPPASAERHTAEGSAARLPPAVLLVLSDYVEGLRGAPTLDDAANALLPIAGGALVEEDGKTLRRGVTPYSLKKDWQNARLYAYPIVITRVSSSAGMVESGFGASALSGRLHKIWIAKREGVQGMPAPISILVPEGHATIRDPKIVSIGSL